MTPLIRYAGIAVIVVIVFGVMYGEVQQAERQSANDPQIQLAEDPAVALNDGITPAALIPAGRVHIESSLAPFVIIYGKTGRVVEGSGYLDDIVPTVPSGMLEAVKGRDYHAVTWQPQNGVRIATVTVSANDYYVMAGRSLREVEKREDAALQIAVLGGVLSLGVLAGVYFFTHPARP